MEIAVLNEVFFVGEVCDTSPENGYFLGLFSENCTAISVLG